MHKTKLTPNERDQIAVLYGQRLSLRAIASRLERNVSSISREIKRNRFGDSYVAISAQYQADTRKVNGRKRQPLKDPITYAYVLEKLRCGWSPEQICGRLKREKGKTILGVETIYRFIYSPKNKDLNLWECLPFKRKRRQEKLGRQAKRLHIPNRVSIHLRPKIVETRKEFGHWEGDTIIGKQEKSKAIHTEVERKTRFLQAKLISSKKPEETVNVQKRIFSDFLCKSVTTDNGFEFIGHEKLKDLGIATYFADPYSSWQRGTNEHHNGLLRRYLPKKTDFENLTQEDLDDMVWEINNKPKKVHDYLTAQEMLILEQKATGVAILVRM